VNPTTYHILVAWREGEAEMSSEQPERFGAARQFFIDQGFMNLQTEWYSPGAAQLPDLIRLFVYWEDPDASPSYEQLRTWGNDSVARLTGRVD
jgi:hypothetical protein